MKKRILLAGALAAVLALALATAAGARPGRSADSAVGAGSTFVAPFMNAWITVFNPKSGNQISYNSVGSGAGIASITARAVDFGASDAPLTADQFTACNNCVQIPIALGATSILYNLPGVTQQLNITGKIIADIYLGKITSWDDPAIKALNSGANLPSARITPAYRSDGSGTSYNFTDYLSKVSPDFASGVGKSTQPPFKVGVGARGSSGVAGVVTSTPGAIGYADVAYALKNHLRFFRVQNAAGKFTTPGIIPTIAAASTIKSVPPDNAISIVDPPASSKTAYPIATFVWAIVPKSGGKNTKLVKQFLLFAISNAGQALGKPLLYTPMPNIVRVASAKTIAQVTGG